MQKLAMMLQFTKQKAQYNCLMCKKVRKKICGDVSTLNHVLTKSKMKLFSEFITKIIITTIIMIQFCLQHFWSSQDFLTTKHWLKTFINKTYKYVQF